MREIKREAFKSLANSRFSQHKNIKAKELANQITKDTLRINEDIPQEILEKSGGVLDVNDNSNPFHFVGETERTDKVCCLYKALEVSLTSKDKWFTPMCEKWIYRDIGSVLPNYCISK